MRYFFLVFGLLILAVMFVAGKRGDISRKPPIFVIPDMDRQPKLRPQKEYSFFPDNRSSRLPVPGTIARGEPYEENMVNTGRIPGGTNVVELLPVPLGAEMMARGQQRFTINCAPCHGAQGDGKGITTKYGMSIIANLHDPRIVKMPDGEIFQTITYGKNLMLPYGGQVEILDRWAIIAYLRALQRSRLGSIDDVPPPQRAALGN